MDSVVSFPSLGLLGAVVCALPLMLLVGLLAWLARPRRGVTWADVQTVYLHGVAFVALVIWLMALFSLVQGVLSLVLTALGEAASRAERWRVAVGLAALLVAGPVWAVHWGLARGQAKRRGGWVAQSLYLYLTLTVLLVAGAVSGGQALAQGLAVLVGAVDWRDVRALPWLGRRLLEGVADGGIALVAWLYHAWALWRMPREP